MKTRTRKRGAALYYLPIDWRRVKFFLAHPTVLPVTDTQPLAGVLRAQYVPKEQIISVISLRDWLYHKVKGYQLFGCYAKITHCFQGIIVAFDRGVDLLRFRQHWQHAPVTP